MIMISAALTIFSQDLCLAPLDTANNKFENHFIEKSFELVYLP